MNAITEDELINEMSKLAKKTGHSRFYPTPMQMLAISKRQQMGLGRREFLLWFNKKFECHLTHNILRTIDGRKE